MTNTLMELIKLFSIFFYLFKNCVEELKLHKHK